jgi:serine/threonine protein kinase
MERQSGYRPHAPQIVKKSLTKNCDERYQSAKDLLIDLRNLKRKLEVDAEIDRTISLGSRSPLATTLTGGIQSTPASLSGGAGLGS